MTPSSVMLAHLYALRAHVEALVLLAEEQTGVVSVEPGSCPKCGASPDQVVDTSTLDGTKRSRCSQCEEEWER